MISYIVKVIASLIYEDAVVNLLLSNGAEGTSSKGDALIPFAIKSGKAEIWDESQLHPADDILEITGYYSSAEALESNKQSIVRSIGELGQIFETDFPLFFDTIAEEEWKERWKEFYKPLSLGDNVVVVPEWLREQYVLDSNQKNNQDKIIITIDPGMAFGTGNHPTTGNAMLLLEKYIKKGDRVLDCGCGTGILACGAGLMGASYVLGVDIDHDAVLATVKNYRLNNLLDVGDVNCKNLVEEKLYQSVPFDIIIANIVPDVIIPLLPKVKPLLKSDGIIILGGIIEAREDEVIEALEEYNLGIKQRISQGDWINLACMDKSML